MKRYTSIMLLLAGLGIFTSCDTEVKVSSDWEDVTVIYGLLDPSAQTNWIRVERGYLGDAPANASFNEPDSLYYDSLNVTLQALEVNSNGVENSVGNPITLEVDYGTKELEEGTFTTQGYRLYKTDAQLDEDLRYRLNVQKIGTDYPDARATTDLVGASGFSFIRPRFVPNQPNPAEFDGRIEWRPSQNASIYEIDIEFDYREFDRTTKATVFKRIKLDYETLSDPINFESKQNRSAFYQMIAGHLEVDDNKLRFFDKMKITIWAGGEHLDTYLQLNEPSAGINQSKPEFPQVENGTGLLSSRTSITLDGIKLTNTSDRKYYLDPILCDRNFAVAEGLDTCFCRQVGDNYERYCP